MRRKTRLALSLTRGPEGPDVEGVTPEDRELLRRLKVTTDPTAFPELLRRAHAAGIDVTFPAGRGGVES